MSSNESERVHVAVDVMTLWYACKDRFGPGVRINYGKLVDLIQSSKRTEERIVKLYAYIITLSDEEETSYQHEIPKNAKFVSFLEKRGYEVKNRILSNCSSITRRQLVTDWVVGITLDAVSVIDTYDTFCLVSGSGDYTMLVNNLKEKDKFVEIVTPKECEPFVLIGKADRIINLTQREMYKEDWVDGEHSQKSRTH
jgi:uncharacterized LabA/DUF88 family protein